MNDKRLYPNTVIFKGTDDNEITYINERVLEQIRAEIENIEPYEYLSEWRLKEDVLQIISKYTKGERK